MTLPVTHVGIELGAIADNVRLLRARLQAGARLAVVVNSCASVTA